MERVFLAMYAVAVVAVPRPISDRRSLGTYVPVDLRCEGPQPPSHLVRDALFPDDEREHLCGTVATRDAELTYAWSRHELFRRDGDAWTFVARSSLAIARVVALPNGGFATVAENGTLLKVSDATLLPDDDLLRRYDLDRVTREQRHEAPPDSPLSCLQTASTGGLLLWRPRPSCSDELSDLAVGISLEGATASVSDHAVRVGEARSRMAQVAAVLASAVTSSTRIGVYVRWRCDEVTGSMTVTGARARALYDLGRGWQSQAAP